MARDWKSLVDRLLEEAQQTGQLNDLPGAGRPLNLDNDPYTPSDMKLAHKLIKDHDLLPEWMLLGKDIEALRERLLDNMRRGVRAYQGALADAARSAQAFDRRQQAETTWNRAVKAYEAHAEKLNREILRYNLKVPQGIPQKALFDVNREIERLFR